MCRIRGADFSAPLFLSAAADGGIIACGECFLPAIVRPTIFSLGKKLLTLRGFIYAEMIVELISKYLETHKRLVVPNLGAFIVKVPGQTVLFSNLIKSDDGVLRSLLAANGVSDMEAAAAVDRFVFEVRFRLQNNGVCRLGGFGELHSGANETVTFIYSPSTQGDGGVDEATKQGAAAPAAPAAQPAAPVQPAAQPVRPAPAQPAAAQAVRPQAVNRDADAAAAARVSSRQVRRAPDVAAPRAAEPRPEMVRERSQRPYEPEAEGGEDFAMEQRPRQDARRDRMKSLYDGPQMTVSPKRHPADYVKGLRYGKGRKVSPDRDMGGARSRRRNDRILIIAIVAAALAIAALGYGYYCDLRAARMESEYYAGPESETANPDMENIETPNE